MRSATPSLLAWLLRLAVITALFVAGVFFGAGTPKRAPADLQQRRALAAPSSTCDLGLGPCRFAFDGHHAVELALTPRPLRTAAPLVVEARVDGAGHNPRVTFTGAAMSMPVTTLPLSPAGQGRFVGRGALPLCTEAVMPWTARVDVDLDGEPHTATFAFTTRKEPAGPEAGAAGAALAVVADDVELLTAGAPIDATLASGDAPLTLASLRGEVVLVAFGFTSCADVCPTTLAGWALALKQLAPDELARVRGLFVSVDPGRDSPAHVDSFARYFHPRLRGATGTREQIDAVTGAFGAVYAVHADAGPDYLVDHSAFTWVVDSSGRVVARLPHAAPADVTVGVLRRFLQVKP